MKKVFRGLNPRLFALVLILICLQLVNVRAQTYVTGGELSQPDMKGFYYHQSAIVLRNGFSSSPTGTDIFRAYIDCAPLAIMPNNSRNYIITFTPRVGGILNPLDQSIQSCSMMSTIQYIDGLGRPQQTIQIKGSPDASRDLIQPFAYEVSGRETIRYLPYTSSSGDGGAYRAEALNGGSGYGSSAQKAFYGLPGQNYGLNPSPYAMKVYEQSPLNRVKEQGSPGDAWQPGSRTAISGRTVVMDYLANNTISLDTDPGQSRLVADYRVTINSDFSRTLTRANNNTAVYSSGMLAVTVIKDENWASGRAGITEEYKDNEGRIILKRAYNLKDGVLEQLSTYYVYDNLGNLAFVLPPKAEPDISGVAVTEQVLNNLCYQYRYDHRNRVSQKKLQGKGWEFFVYNKLDQPVLSQDAEQRKKSVPEWTYMKYDVQGRLIIRGTMQDAGTGPETNAGSPSLLRLQYFQGVVNALAINWETPTGSSANYGYTNDSFPATTALGVLQVNYYDSYNFMGSNPYPYSGGSTITRGLLTGSQVNVLGGNVMLWTVNHYDEQGRNIRTFKQHYLNSTANAGNYDEISVTYDFTDNITSQTLRHVAGGNTALTAVTSCDYDHLGRKIRTWEQINAGAKVLMAENVYNELGQTYLRKLHSEDNGSTYLQTVSNSYNERGWLKSSTSTLFSVELKYNDPLSGTAPQFNGNIANQLWGAGATMGKNFVYSYDNMNRLTSGVSVTGGMSESSIGYDKMGNIKQLTRDGVNYQYSNIYEGFDGNMLNSISGLTTGNYHYDGNGNMDADARTGVTLIYNTLNLPQAVSKAGLSMSYIYNSEGEKLRKISNGTATDYIDGIVYGNISGSYGIDFLQTETGRAYRRSDNTYRYEYDLSDHLGNVRVTFQRGVSGVAERVQSDDYYAFGKRSSQSPVEVKNKYLYNSKELQEELGQYDYGARFYDPVIGRWTVVDPLTEKTVSINQYAYGENNPIKMVDGDGRYAVSVHYKITYMTLLGLGYSKKDADRMAHYSSTYADHPSGNVGTFDYVLHSPKGNRADNYRAGIDYSKTAGSQDEKNSMWHSMMSDAEADAGMSEEQATARGLKFGWDNLFSSKGGEDLEKVGQGMHALQDAIAHHGMKTNNHLGFNTSSAKAIFNDLYGNTEDAANLTRSAGIVLRLIAGKEVTFRKKEELNLKGMSTEQFNQTLNLLIGAGFQGKITMN